MLRIAAPLWITAIALLAGCRALPPALPETSTAPPPSSDGRVVLDRIHRDNNLGRLDLSALDAVGVIAPIDASAGRVYAFGSGFLIDACHVLTAEHVMYGWRGDYDSAPPLGQAVQFALGQVEPGADNRTEGLKYALRGRVTAHGGTGRHDGRSDQPQLDWALVTLESRVDGIEPLPLAALDPTDGSAANWIVQHAGAVGAAGYPGDHMAADPERAHDRLWGSFGQVLQVTYDPGTGLAAMAITNPATSGTSGGPLFADVLGREAAVGIVQSVFGDGIHDKERAPTLAVLITPRLLEELDHAAQDAPCP